MRKDFNSYLIGQRQRESLVDSSMELNNSILGGEQTAEEPSRSPPSSHLEKNSKKIHNFLFERRRRQRFTF